METGKLAAGLFSLALLAGAGRWALAQPGEKIGKPAAVEVKDSEESDEEVITLAKAPEAVRTAALKLAGGEKAITKVIKEEDEEDVYTYEIEYTVGGVECTAVFSTSGDVMELEKGMADASLPAAVTAALKKEYPNATFKDPNSVQKFYYEVDVVIDGKSHEIKVDAAGNIEDEKGEEEADKKDGKDGKHAAAGVGEFRQNFAVDKANLTATGINPFFNLTPGTVNTFREGDTTLVITVLNETRTVDGVTTRVVEERETANGKPKEISKNYFAIDKTNNDVYYFGEAVDETDTSGKVTHPGVWLSGEKGAHFGLMMPGTPKVGDKFYQEVAPGVAMDRFEVVGVDEEVQTPAGKFEHCLHVVETTPLENDIGHKWYVRGVGLVKDGKAELVSAKPEKK